MNSLSTVLSLSLSLCVYEQFTYMTTEWLVFLIRNGCCSLFPFYHSVSSAQAWVSSVVRRLFSQMVWLKSVSIQTLWVNLFLYAMRMVCGICFRSIPHRLGWIEENPTLEDRVKRNSSSSEHNSNDTSIKYHFCYQIVEVLYCILCFLFYFIVFIFDPGILHFVNVWIQMFKKCRW